MSAWVRGIQLYRSLQVLRGFFDGFFLVTQNAQMKMRSSEIGLQPQRLRKLRFRALGVRLLHQHSAEIVVQFRSLRLKPERAPEFADGAVEIPGKIECPCQNVMGLGIVRGQPHRLLRLLERGTHVSFSKQRAGEIHVRQRKIGIQFHRSLEMSDRGIDLALREQDPAEGVVSLWTLRRKPHNFLEIRASRNQIALL